MLPEILSVCHASFYTKSLGERKFVNFSYFILFKLTCNSRSVCFCCSIFLLRVSTFDVRVVTDAFRVNVSFSALALSFSRVAWKRFTGNYCTLNIQ